MEIAGTDIHPLRSSNFTENIFLKQLASHNTHSAIDRPKISCEGALTNCPRAGEGPVNRKMFLIIFLGHIPLVTLINILQMSELPITHCSHTSHTLDLGPGISGIRGEVFLF